jgi:hypothetical protein
MDNFDLRKYLIENKATANSRILKEEDFKDFLNSLDIDTSDIEDADTIEVGDDVATIKGPGTVLDIDSENETYTVDLGKSRPYIASFLSVKKLGDTIDSDHLLISDIDKLEQEHRAFQKNFVNLDFRSQNAVEDFKSEYWKLSKICDFYLELGQEMWNMFKRNRKFIQHSDEFEDLFFEVANFLVSLQKLDNNQDQDLNMLVRSFAKIGNRIGAGVV